MKASLGKGIGLYLTAVVAGCVIALLIAWLQSTPR